MPRIVSISHNRPSSAIQTIAAHSSRKDLGRCQMREYPQAGPAGGIRSISAQTVVEPEGSQNSTGLCGILYYHGPLHPLGLASPSRSNRAPA